jgi:hypothetical protein
MAAVVFEAVLTNFRNFVTSGKYSVAHDSFAVENGTERSDISFVFELCEVHADGDGIGRGQQHSAVVFLCKFLSGLEHVLIVSFPADLQGLDC